MYRRVLIPNRGEIAVRIIKACRELGVETVLAASTVDADSSLAARLAGRVIRIGGPRPAESYLNVAAILAAAKAADVDAVHPGYGFLSEDRRLAEACRELGVDFVGPPPEVLEKVGNKATARRIAEMAGVPVAPGRLLSSELSTDLLRVIESEIGYPVLIKAVHGGGGRGMRLVTSPAELRCGRGRGRGRGLGGVRERRALCRTFRAESSACRGPGPGTRHRGDTGTW